MKFRIRGQFTNV